MQTNQDRKFSSRVYIFTGGGGREEEKNEKENCYCTYEKDKSEGNSCFYVIEIFKRGNIGKILHLVSFISYLLSIAQRFYVYVLKMLISKI